MIKLLELLTEGDRARLAPMIANLGRLDADLAAIKGRRRLAADRAAEIEAQAKELEAKKLPLVDPHPENKIDLLLNGGSGSNYDKNEVSGRRQWNDDLDVRISVLESQAILLRDEEVRCADQETALTQNIRSTEMATYMAVGDVAADLLDRSLSALFLPLLLKFNALNGALLPKLGKYPGRLDVSLHNIKIDQWRGMNCIAIWPSRTKADIAPTARSIGVDMPDAEASLRELMDALSATTASAIDAAAD